MIAELAVERLGQYYGEILPKGGRSRTIFAGKAMQVFLLSLKPIILSMSLTETSGYAMTWHDTVGERKWCLIKEWFWKRLDTPHPLKVRQSCHD